MFEATVGASYDADIAIDDVLVTPGVCPCKFYQPLVTAAFGMQFIGFRSRNVPLEDECNQSVEARSIHLCCKHGQVDALEVRKPGNSFWVDVV